MSAPKKYRPGIIREVYVASFRLESGELLTVEYESRTARFFDLAASRYWNRAWFSTRRLVEPSNN